MRLSSVMTVLIGLSATAIASTGIALAGHEHFDDVAGSPHQDGIHWLADARVTGGCDDNSYCPATPVSRAQMATFMRRLAGADPAVPPSVNADKLDGLDAEDLRGAQGPAGPAGPAGPGAVTSLLDVVYGCADEPTSHTIAFPGLEDELSIYLNCIPTTVQEPHGPETHFTVTLSARPLGRESGSLGYSETTTFGRQFHSTESHRLEQERRVDSYNSNPPFGHWRAVGTEDTFELIYQLNYHPDGIHVLAGLTATSTTFAE